MVDECTGRRSSERGLKVRKCSASKAKKTSKQAILTDVCQKYMRAEPGTNASSTRYFSRISLQLELPGPGSWDRELDDDRIRSREGADMRA